MVKGIHFEYFTMQKVSAKTSTAVLVLGISVAFDNVNFIQLVYAKPIIPDPCVSPLPHQTVHFKLQRTNGRNK